MDIKKEYEIPFPLAAVFAAWISPAHTVDPVTAIEIEPVVGGVFRLTVGTGDEAGRMDGRIQAIEPNQLLRYTWHWGGPGEPSVVTARFSESEQGTRIELEHMGLESAESVAMHDSGWDSYLQGLQGLLAKA